MIGRGQAASVLGDCMGKGAEDELRVACAAPGG